MLFNLLDSSPTWYFFSFDSTENIIRSVALWLTLALIAAFVVLALTLHDDARKKLLKISGFTAIIYAAIVSVTFLTLNFTDIAESGRFSLDLFLPLLILILSVALTALVLIYGKEKTPKLAASLISICALVAVIIVMVIRYGKGDSTDINGLTKDDVNSIALYLTAVAVTAAVIFAVFAFDKNKSEFDTRTITYAAVSIAMSFALSYVRIVKMPQGGSITIASLLPLMLYSYMFGIKKGLLAGMIYGLLQAIQDPYILHPAQFLLDYPLAFGCIGLGGIFGNLKKLENIPQLQFACGAAIAGILRFVMHFLSGVFAFSAYADGQNPYIYSLTYQAAYVLPDIAILIAVGIALFSSHRFVMYIRSVRDGLKHA